VAVDRGGRLDAIEEAMRHRRSGARSAAYTEAKLGEVGGVRVDDRLCSNQAVEFYTMMHNMYTMSMPAAPAVELTSH
jgi:hypothetical protein